MDNKNGSLNFQEFQKPTYSEWREAAEKLLKGKPYDKIMLTKTAEDIVLDPIYMEKDIENIDHIGGYPGEFPFVRGTKPEGYLKNSWLFAQPIYQPDPKLFNLELKDSLKRGQNCIHIKLDTPSKLGTDIKNLKIENIGKNGVSIYSKSDWEISLEEIDLSNTPFRIDAGYGTVYHIDNFIKTIKKNGIKLEKTKGVVKFDPIEMIIDNNIDINLDTLYENMYQLTKYAIDNGLNWRTITVSTTPFHNRGGNVIQDIGYMGAIAVEYIDKMVQYGLDIEKIFDKIEVEVSVGTNFFMEIAKLRAIKMVWTNIANAYGVENCKIYIHVKTSNFHKTDIDPYVNILRSTTESLSSIVGHVDSLEITPFDSDISDITPLAKRVARNTHIILKDESHFDFVIDPSAGSYFVENLTDKLAKEGWLYFQKIVDKNILTCLKDGTIKNDIKKVVDFRQKEINRGKDVKVGVNMYANIDEKEYNFKYDEAVLKKRYKEIENILADNDQMDSFEIKKLAEIVSNGANLSNYITSMITEGEQFDLNDQFRISEKFENLRKLVKNHGKKVFLVTMGSVKQHKARADFSKNFFEAGGFEVIYPKNNFLTPEEGAEKTALSKSDIAVLCSTDMEYPNIAKPFVDFIKKDNKDIKVVVAGYPKDSVDKLKDDGIDNFIHIKSDRYNTLYQLAKDTGVKL